MAKKLSHEDVKTYIENEGYTLLNTYKDSKTKLKLRCPEGHVYYVIWNSFRKGHRCSECSPGGRKRTQEEAKKIITAEGYTLLSDYRGSHNKVTLKCPEGHIYNVAFNSFLNGNRCPECAKVIRGQKRKTPHSKVKKYVEQYGYTLITEYTLNNRRFVKLKCSSGHYVDRDLANFRQGEKKCPVCNNQVGLEYEYVKGFIEEKGYKLLNNTYRSNCHKLNLICNKGHFCSISFANFKRGRRCPICSGKKPWPFSEVREYVENEGYYLINHDEQDGSKKSTLQCPEGHTFSVRFSDFRAGRRCPTCVRNAQSSKPEKAIQKITKELTSNVICNDRSQVKNPYGRYLELDVFIPNLNKAIEFNGKYWHSFEHVKQKDRIKAEQCRKQGIDLLVIKEEDWLEDKEACLNQVKDFVLEESQEECC